MQVEGVLQQVDNFLEERLRNANSDMSNAEAKEGTYLQLEAIVGELEETDVSSALSSFFAAVNDVLNEPDSRLVRNLVALEGTTLSSTITHLHSRIQQLREDTDDRIGALSGEINGILGGIGRLNVQVTTAEGGGSSNSDAVGLRDRRLTLLGELSNIIDIQVREQKDGSITVLSNGEFLVSQGTVREVKTSLSIDESMPLAAVHLVATDAPLRSTAGKPAGLITARDEILGGFLNTNLNSTKSFLTATESSVASVTDTIQNIRGLAISVTNTTTSDIEREAVVAEIRRSIDQLVATGNGEFRNRFLFGGSQTNTDPFSRINNFVDFRGNANSLQSYIDIDLLQDANVTANEVFGVVSEGTLGGRSQPHPDRNDSAP